MTVAVIDDDDLITRLVERVLERMGFGNVLRLTKPTQFLDMVSEGLSGVHVVICDIGMPNVDGYQILAAVRASEPDLPFIMLTADMSSEAVSRAIEGGVSAYAVKPVVAQSLMSKISTVVERAYGVRA